MFTGMRFMRSPLNGLSLTTQTFTLYTVRARVYLLA